MRVICPDWESGSQNQDAHRVHVICWAVDGLYNRTLIACPHLARGTVSNSLSKEYEVYSGSLAWVNSTKSKGQDFYYGLVPYQTQTSHLSIT